MAPPTIPTVPGGIVAQFGGITLGPGALFVIGLATAVLIVILWIVTHTSTKTD